MTVDVKAVQSQVEQALQHWGRTTLGYAAAKKANPKTFGSTENGRAETCLRNALALLNPMPDPPPAGVVDGIGIVRYAGSLSGTSHLSSYGMIITDWDTVDVGVGQSEGLVFGYQNLGPPGFKPVNLNDAAAFVKLVLAKQSATGMNGVFLDNCSEGDSPTQLRFLKAIGPALKAQGVLVMLNAVAASGSGGNDGTNDARWYGTVGPYATHLMSELWMQGRGGPELYRLRHRGAVHYSDYWDEWLKVPEAAHKVGCAFVGMTYGSLSNAIYGRASLLLVAEPGDVFCWNPDTTPSGTDPYNPAWMQALGAPLEPVGSNPRQFANPGAPTFAVVTVDPVKGTASIS